MLPFNTERDFALLNAHPSHFRCEADLSEDYKKTTLATATPTTGQGPMDKYTVRRRQQAGTPIQASSRGHTS